MGGDEFWESTIIMLVGYARVSTDLQTTDGQIDALKAAGCERVFEESISGTRADRPQLAAALEYAREGDILVVARLDQTSGGSNAGRRIVCD
jgi:DNA invertase Pin-like site-specific DNA recombinase